MDEQGCREQGKLTKALLINDIVYDIIVLIGGE